MADSTASFIYEKYLWQGVLLLPGFWLIALLSSLDYLEHTMLQVFWKEDAILVAWLSLVIGEYKLLLIKDT